MTESVHDESDLLFESAADNPELLAAAQKVISGAPEEPEPQPELPTDGPVTLPVGFRRRDITATGTEVVEVRTAWVRELNGEDEERIARAKMRDDMGAFVATLLECGVEKLGDERPTKDDFNALVEGDRQYLLQEIARATYGDKIEYDKVTCQFCGEEFSVSLSVGEDIPVKRYDSAADADFEVKLSKDRVASVTLPTVEVSALTAKAETDAEVNTILIANCVHEIRGPKGTVTISGDKDAARRLSIPDRHTLIEEMSERMPGPQYNEIKFKHEPGCGEEIRLGVTLADLFRGM